MVSLERGRQRLNVPWSRLVDPLTVDDEHVGADDFIGGS